MKQSEIVARAKRDVYSLPMYQDLNKTQRKMLEAEMVDACVQEQFCKDYGIEKIQATNVNEQSNKVLYCGQVIEFRNAVEVDSFIADMYDLSCCCALKINIQ